MAPKCRPDVAAARAQTSHMINEAEKVISDMPQTLSGPRKGKAYALVPPAQRTAAHCAPRLEAARAAFAAAGEAKDPLAQRDGYIRATYQAGQALSCARTANIGTKLGVAPKPKKKKPKKPKAEE